MEHAVYNKQIKQKQLQNQFILILNQKGYYSQTNFA